MMPLMVPVTIAAYSIVGEKVTRSLEPLLATPISTTKLLLGKGLAAALPGIVTAWISYGLFLIGRPHLRGQRPGVRHLRQPDVAGRHARPGAAADDHGGERRHHRQQPDVRTRALRSSWGA